MTMRPPMPARSEDFAPRFSPDQPRELRRYFSELSDLFRAHSITTASEQKYYATRYLDIDSADLWEMLPEFAPTSSYQDFIAAVHTLYPGSEGPHRWSIANMEDLVTQQCLRVISDMSALGSYYRSFFQVSSSLRKVNRISSGEQSRAFLRGFQAPIRRAIILRLEIKLPDHFPDDPYVLSDVYDAALFVLRSAGTCAPAALTATPCTRISHPELGLPSSLQSLSPSAPLSASSSSASLSHLPSPSSWLEDASRTIASRLQYPAAPASQPLPLLSPHIDSHTPPAPYTSAQRIAEIESELAILRKRRELVTLREHYVHHQEGLFNHCKQHATQEIPVDRFVSSSGPTAVYYTNSVQPSTRIAPTLASHITAPPSPIASLLVRSISHSLSPAVPLTSTSPTMLLTSASSSVPNTSGLSSPSFSLQTPLFASPVVNISTSQPPASLSLCVPTASHPDLGIASAASHTSSQALVPARTFSPSVLASPLPACTAHKSLESPLAPVPTSNPETASPLLRILSPALLSSSQPRATESVLPAPLKSFLLTPATATSILLTAISSAAPVSSSVPCILSLHPASLRPTAFSPRLSLFWCLDTVHSSRLTALLISLQHASAPALIPCCAPQLQAKCQVGEPPPLFLALISFLIIAIAALRIWSLLCSLVD